MVTITDEMGNETETEPVLRPLSVSEQLTAEEALQRIADAPFKGLILTPGWAKEFAAAHLNAIRTAALQASHDTLETAQQGKGEAREEAIRECIEEVCYPADWWFREDVAQADLLEDVRDRLRALIKQGEGNG